jgi:hypothetical protein
LSCRILTTADADEWRRELGLFSESDVYFLAEFHRACEVNGDGKARAFVFEDAGERLFHPFLVRPIAQVGDEPAPARVYDIESVVGYTGPLATTVDPAFLGRAWSAFGDSCRSRGIVAEFVRFNPLLGNERYASDSYEIRCDRKLVVIRLDWSEDELWTSYLPRQRKNVRKAIKSGLVAGEMSAVDDFVDFRRLYEQTIRRQENPNYFASDAYLEHLRDSLGEAFRLFGVWADGKLVAVHLFLLHGDRMYAHLAGRDEQERQGATNLLLHTAARWGSERGLRWLHLGGGRTASPDDRLLIFKASFSRLRLGYLLGRRIHDPAAYQTLCDAWLGQSRGRQLPDHTFPYRSPIAPS